MSLCYSKSIKLSPKIPQSWLIEMSLQKHQIRNQKKKQTQTIISLLTQNSNNLKDKQISSNCITSMIKKSSQRRSHTIPSSLLPIQSIHSLIEEDSHRNPNQLKSSAILTRIEINEIPRCDYKKDQKSQNSN